MWLSSWCAFTVSIFYIPFEQKDFLAFEKKKKNKEDESDFPFFSIRVCYNAQAVVHTKKRKIKPQTDNNKKRTKKKNIKREDPSQCGQK